MAARDGEVGYDQLHHFIASGVWDTARIEKALLAAADRMVGGRDAWLIVDDTALPKKGEHSVGVAPQYASSLGKTANCQSLVSLTLASREVPVTVGLRLFLPEDWTSDPARLARARVPEERRNAVTKPEIAIEEIDRVIASGARFGCVLADSGYGSSGSFRQALSERGLKWAVGLSAERLSCRRRFDLSYRQGRKAAQIQHPGSASGLRRSSIVGREMAKGQLAAGHKGPADMSLCGPPRVEGASLPRQDGEPSGINRIHRLYREEGLTVGKRRGRRRAAGNAGADPAEAATLSGFWTLSMTSSDVIDDSAS